MDIYGNRSLRIRDNYSSINKILEIIRFKYEFRHRRNVGCAIKFDGYCEMFPNI